jgi:ABC-type branched-subunit amino acid transport system substrate-binding protein
MPRPRTPLVLLCAAASACAACGESSVVEPDPLHVAVAMRAPADGGLPNMEWALENVNAAGGVAGRGLVLDYVDPEVEDLAALGEALAADERYVAVIGPPGSAGLQAVAGAFIEHDRPVVSTTSTSDDLLRAYGGKGAVWRTRESDIAQTELLVRFARENGAKRVALLTSLGVSGYTFFSWFGFFASELGYAEEDVHIVTLPEAMPCDGKVPEALATMPDMLFVAPGAPEDVACVVKSLPPPGMPRPRVVFADTGLDLYDLEKLGPAAEGVEGFTGAGDEAFELAFGERFPGARLAPHGASEYDAVLLLAYGLEVSGGEGGKALIAAMKEAVDGTDDSTSGWDGAGVADNLAALRAGQRPRLQGATGPLDFEPELYMDLASSTLAHFEVGPEGLALGDRFWTGDPSFLCSQGAFVKPGLAPEDVDQSTWTPALAKTDTWAVIAALSLGWSNYRHQADAIQQYRTLRANGVDDDHIVLVLADDIAEAPDNDLPGVVRNEPLGDNLYTELQIDYDLSLTAEDLTSILTGQVTATTPAVIHPTASSNVYLYLVGHGGVSGIPLSASTPEEGIDGGQATFSPTALREALCALQEGQRYRRVLAVIESCYAGAFGDAAHDGLEQGCVSGGADVPLEGVVLLTAATSKEVSFAGEYDDEVPAWVNDAFSRRLAEQTASAPDTSLAELYIDVYQGTFGSHPSVFNADHAGRLSLVPHSEFVTP